MSDINDKFSDNRAFYLEQMMEKLSSIEHQCKKIRTKAESTNVGYPSEAFSHIANLAAEAGAYAAKYEVLREITIIDR